MTRRACGQSIREGSVTVMGKNDARADKPLLLKLYEARRSKLRRKANQH